MNQEQNVKHVLARYVRAADKRDGMAMGDLFVDNACVEIYEGQQEPRQIGELKESAAIGAAVAGLLQAHPPCGWSHHTTHDTIIEIDGEVAVIDAQFIVYTTIGAIKPSEGWPEDAFGAQGRVIPIEAGYYRSRLVRKDGQWKIAYHRIYLDFPMAFPKAAV